MPAFYREWFYRAKLSMMARVITKPQPKPLVFLGPGARRQLCANIAELGCRRTLVVTDAPLHELGLLDDTLEALKAQGIEPTVYDGVQPDPTISVVNAGIAAFQAADCDSVLAFGGGSSIDSAKVIALAAANGVQAADCLGLGKCEGAAAPFFAIPTTAGTGSEGTFIAVISDDETHAKGGVIDPKLIPRAAALDPELMVGLPASITAATGMDALTHAIESYIGTWETPETDGYGLASAKLVFDNLETACSDGSNLEARSAMALASFYGGLAITNALVGYVHAISHNLGARYGIPHGLGNAMVLPHVLELLRESAEPRLAALARHCGIGDAGGSDAQLAAALVDRVRELNERIGIPKTTDKIRAEDLDELVKAALAEGSAYPTPRFLEPAECRGVLQAMMA